MLPGNFSSLSAQMRLSQVSSLLSIIYDFSEVRRKMLFSLIARYTNNICISFLIENTPQNFSLTENILPECKTVFPVILAEYQSKFKNTPFIMVISNVKILKFIRKRKKMFQSILFDIFRDQKLWPINTKLIGYYFERLKYYSFFKITDIFFFAN